MTPEGRMAGRRVTPKRLTYLHYVLMYATRGRTVKNALVGAVDRRYLLRGVKEAMK